MNTISLTSKITRNKEIPYTNIDKDLILLDPNMNRFCNVNYTGALLWELLENNDLTLEEICKHIQIKFDITENECRNDIIKFVVEMAELNFLIIVDEFLS